jgi:hypothetical protein
MNPPMSTPADDGALRRQETRRESSEFRRVDQGFEHMLAPTVLAVVSFLSMLLLVLWTTRGHFTYTLDDPYIHLALARNIWHGHYGINASEFSAPSSSILWPFLLAPFSANARLFEYAPLILNFLCLWATIVVLWRIFGDLRAVWHVVVVGSIVLSLNLLGLVFTGMEHSLQVMLVVVGMQPLILGDRGGGQDRRVPAYIIAALIALPLVRYEGLAISLPVLFFLFSHGHRKTAVLSVTVIGIALVSFSAFLHANGSIYLPSSILAKEDLSVLGGVTHNLKANLEAYGFLLLPVIWILGAYWKTSRSRFAVVLAATALHFLFGHVGWFARYEAYYVIFIVVLSIRLAVDLHLDFMPAIFCLPLVFASLTVATVSTPLAAANIYNQQVQMARIAVMLGEPVAVNDLGIMALRSGHYTLDLWGLGSIEALRERLQATDSSGWVAALMTKKRVQYAFVYDSWFPDRPASWIKVGQLKLLQKRITPASDLVSFYADDPSSAEKLRSTLATFAQQNVSHNYALTIY